MRRSEDCALQHGQVPWGNNKPDVFREWKEGQNGWYQVHKVEVGNELGRLTGAKWHGSEFEWWQNIRGLNQNKLESERGCFINYLGHRDNRHKLGTISGKPGCLLTLQKDWDFTLKCNEKLWAGNKPDCRKFEMMPFKGSPELILD